MKNPVKIALLSVFIVPAYAELPDPGMSITQGNTALVSLSSMTHNRLLS